MANTPIPADNVPENVYESCHLISHTPFNPRRLGHTFAVSFEEFQGGPVFSYIKIEITCNRYTQLFINAHPQWKKGCVPFLLFTLKDYLLELKTIEVPMGRPTVISGGYVDKTDERLETYFEIEAAIVNTTILQNWLLPVANIANTHVDDQLRRFYIDNPHCIPTRTRRVKVLLDNQEKIRRSDTENKARQAEERARLVPADGVAYLFADESGDPGFRDWSSSYITTVCSIPAGSLDSVRSCLTGLLTKHWSQKNPGEIHFSKLSKEQREAISPDLAKCITDNSIKVFCFEAIKANYLKYLLRCEAELRKNEEYPIKTVISEVPSDPKANVIFNFLALSVEEIIGHIGSEAIVASKDIHLVHDRKHKTWMNDAITAGVARGITLIKNTSFVKYGEQLAPKVTHELTPSTQEPCLWLSDWISNEMANWGKGVNFSQSLESCIKNILFIGYDDDGVKWATHRPGTPAHLRFPDIPREIYRGEGAAELPSEEGA